MGFLGKLFGGSGKKSSASAPQQQAPVRNSSSSDSAPDMPMPGAAPQPEQPQSAFIGQHFEGLGDVWKAFFKEGTQEFVNNFPTLFEKCAPAGPAMHLKDGTVIVRMDYPVSGGIGIHSHIRIMGDNKEADFIGGYPYLEGAPAKLALDQAHIWSNNVCGTVAVHSPELNLPFSLFLSGFFQQVPRIQFGGELEFSLAGLALGFEKQVQTEFCPEKGTELYNEIQQMFLAANPDQEASDFEPPVLSSRGRGILMPSEFVSLWQYQVPVLEKEKVEFLGQTFLRIKTIFGGHQDANIPGILYVAEHVYGDYEPEIGDDVTGVLWLQGGLDGYPEYPTHPQAAPAEGEAQA